MLRKNKLGQSQESGCSGLDECIQVMKCEGNCNGHYNISEAMKYEKATTVPDVEKRLKNMEIYLELDYEKGSQIEGCVHLPDFDTWLEDIMMVTEAGGGHARVQDGQVGGAEGLEVRLGGGMEMIKMIRKKCQEGSNCL